MVGNAVNMQAKIQPASWSHTDRSQRHGEQSEHSNTLISEQCAM